MKFVSTSIEKVGNEDYKLKGKLTSRGISRPVELDVTYVDKVMDPWGIVFIKICK